MYNHNGKFVSEEVHMGDTVEISLHKPNTSPATSIWTTSSTDFAN